MINLEMSQTYLAGKCDVSTPVIPLNPLDRNKDHIWRKLDTIFAVSNFSFSIYSSSVECMH